eukprot:4793986-Prorocentrum_lima.AAC.1
MDAGAHPPRGGGKPARGGGKQRPAAMKCLPSCRVKAAILKPKGEPRALHVDAEEIHMFLIIRVKGFPAVLSSKEGDSLPELLEGHYRPG